MDRQNECRRWACVAIVLIFHSATAVADEQRPTGVKGCEELFRSPGVVWRGAAESMTFQRVAEYTAPVIWLSPDEPTLKGLKGPEIRVPAAFPFDSEPAPVVYYQFTRVSELGRGGLEINPSDKAQSVLHFDKVTSLWIKYIAYFPEEAGLGQHPHDVEPAEFRVAVGRADGPLAQSAGYTCDSHDYLMIVGRVTGEAHGNPWYYNILQVGSDTSLPIHLLVEEGKHAMATDRNADGYYTPGYDVTSRTNDAWGVRDTLRGGTLFSGKFESWMAKVRKPEHRVLPPLPRDSPLRSRLVTPSGELLPNAVYDLRPYPSASAATDELLRRKIAEKETPNWPEQVSRDDLGPIIEAFVEGRELKPYSIAYRYDQAPGLAVAFPLLFVKNVREPLAGGYLVNRLYAKDHLHDWGWMVMYTPSGSRWFDQYVAAGVDSDSVLQADDSRVRSYDFVAEAGIKLRFRAPNRALEAIMNFWGVRLGVKSVGAMDIDRLSYIIEVGAGVW